MTVLLSLSIYVMDRMACAVATWSSSSLACCIPLYELMTQRFLGRRVRASSHTPRASDWASFRWLAISVASSCQTACPSLASRNRSIDIRGEGSF
ncbi:hypothetical protein C8Q72DRAFT_480076 [Fomitopsis betulina]|nr:hypothetical protein C8Q72DRAFT_480076 [Fomitopsis betulina]